MLDIASGIIIGVLVLHWIASGTLPDHLTFKSSWWRYLDDTDNRQTGERSGLCLYIDHGTGLHYIRGVFGSIIPRLDKDGNHMCENGEDDASV